mgnify:CR=1 FL=1
MLEIICPHCDNTIEVIRVVVQDSLRCQNKKEIMYMTRLEMAKEEAKPRDERQWIAVGYEASKDRFRVVKGKLYNEN